MRRFITPFLIISLLALIPYVSSAAPLVPCTGTDCEACHVAALIQTIINFLLVYIAVPIGIILLAYTGFQAIGAGVQGGSGAPLIRKRLGNMVFGFALMLSSWLIVDTAIKFLFDAGRFGAWNKIDCVGVAEPQNTITHPTVQETQQEKQQATTTTQKTGSKIVTANGTCENCVSLKESGITCGPNSNCNLDAETASKLAALNDSTKGMVVTEGFPPKIQHKNQCHSNGTCVDATIADKSVDAAKKFMDSAKSNNLRAVWEGKDCSMRDALQSAGYTAYCSSDSGYSHITGTHFSVYNK